MITTQFAGFTSANAFYLWSFEQGHADTELCPKKE